MGMLQISYKQLDGILYIFDEIPEIMGAKQTASIVRILTMSSFVDMVYDIIHLQMNIAKLFITCYHNVVARKIFVSFLLRISNLVISYKI